MGHSIVLHLVADEGTNSDSGDDAISGWPGAAGSYNFGPAGASAFTLPVTIVRRVWFGVSEDLTGVKVWPESTPLAQITGDGAARIYQGTEVVDSADHRFAFSEGFDEVQAALRACCNTAIDTVPYVFKRSNVSLDPTQPDPPCGAEAFFKWLATLATVPQDNYDYTFYAKLTSRDLSKTWEINLALNQALAATVQEELAWPTDFIGLVGLDSVELVANTGSDDATHKRVSNFDGGTLLMRTSIRSLGGDHPVLFAQTEQTFRLPDTDCAGEGSSDSSGE